MPKKNLGLSRISWLDFDTLNQSLNIILLAIYPIHQ